MTFNSQGRGRSTTRTTERSDGVSCSVVSNSVTPWTVVHQVPLEFSMEFSRQEYWNGLPFPSPGDLPYPGIKPRFLHCRQSLYWLSHQGQITWHLNYLAFNSLNILLWANLNRVSLKICMLKSVTLNPPLKRWWLFKIVDTTERLTLFKIKWSHWSEVSQSCLTLCNPMDCNLPGSFQARILEWVAISFSRGSSRLRDWTQVFRIAGRRFTL